MDVDPITLEVISHGLISITNQIDVVCVESGGGGGYGPPGERPRNLVLRDLAREYVSAEAAEPDYGVEQEASA